MQRSPQPPPPPPSIDMDAAARCMLSSLIAPHSAHSQHGEDVLLLPTLLKATGGSPGTFVEIGAYDGKTFSNTLMLERCLNWTGMPRSQAAP